MYNNRIRAAVCFLVNALGATGLRAQSSDPRITWLQDKTIPIRSFTPADTVFDDLARVGEAIGEARMVLLGEQTHGDGTTFLMKSRLIKYLHEKKGFDVIAFESGLFDVARSWDFIVSGEAPATAARRGIFGLWSRSEQVQSLLDYLGVRAKSDRPLVLAGFDSQPTGTASQQLLRPALDSFLVQHRISLTDVLGPDVQAMFDTLMTPSGYVQPKPAADRRSKLMVALDTLTARVARIQDTSATVAFWKQVTKSMRAHGAYTMSYDMTKPTEIVALGNARDTQMADNLLWLARQRFAGKKIIVWGASFHTMRNPSTVTNFPPYQQVETVGNLLFKALGAEVFSIGFLATQGMSGAVGQRPRVLPPVAPEGIEGLWSKTTHALGMVNLRNPGPGGDWLNSEMFAGPMAYSQLRAKWPQMFDALIYTRVMEPSTRARQ